MADRARGRTTWVRSLPGGGGTGAGGRTGRLPARPALREAPAVRDPKRIPRPEAGVAGRWE
ncbi:hypothetical protein BN2537_9831 [Streptomyces venezuelae]|nr:hypothetical protein BN2537_9831 [Streptomyces venezuelae]